MVKYSDLEMGFDFVSFGGVEESEAWLCLDIGVVYCHSEFGDDEEELPDDVGSDRYIAIPHKTDLDLGKPLVLEFTAAAFPDKVSEVREIFSHPGAYARFKSLLEDCDKLQQWYDHEARKEKEALLAWCEENGIEVEHSGDAGVPARPNFGVEHGGVTTVSDRPVINVNSVELSESRHGTRFESATAQLASQIGANKLGCRLTVVPAGKRAFPLHSHHANEELFFILEGYGTYRFGEKTYPVKAGDLLAAPVGGAEHAHQIVNDSDAPLKYLSLSTMLEPEVMEYPDSGKFGVFAGSAPGGAKEERTFSRFVPTDAEVSYWHKEE